MDFKIKNPTTTITAIFTESRNATQATARPYCLLTNSVLGLGVSTAFCVTVQSSLGNALLLTDYFKSPTYISKGLKSNPHRRMVHLQIMVVWVFSKLSSSRHSQGFSLSLSPPVCKVLSPWSLYKSNGKTVSSKSFSNPKDHQNSFPEPDLKGEVITVCAWGLLAAFSPVVFLPLHVQPTVALEKSKL